MSNWSSVQPDALQLKISKQVRRQLDGIQLVHLKREQRQQNLGFSSRPFILCGLPIRRPPAGQLLFERRNGHFLLQVTGHPDYGVPFGQDRIVPIFLATLAVRQQSQTIRFKSGAEMLETFGMQKGGREYRLVAAFERIFGATIFFSTDNQLGRARVVHMARFAFLREAQIWYDHSTRSKVSWQNFENIVVLSEEFYKEVMAHPIPTDLEAVKVLSGAPAVLDLFMCLCYRCFVSSGEEVIPLFGKYGLTAQLGSYSRPRRFRAMLDQWLGVVRAIWPECPARITGDGQFMKINRGTPVLPSCVSNVSK